MRYEDVDRLKPGEYLNDNLVDLFLRLVAQLLQRLLCNFNFNLSLKFYYFIESLANLIGRTLTK